MTGLTRDNPHLSEATEPGGAESSDGTFADVCKFSSDPGPGQGDERVQRYLGAARSANTLRAYRSDLAHFLSFGGTLPAEPSVVARYLAAMAGRLSNATLQRRLIAIGQAHTNRSLSNPCKADMVRLTFRGIRRVHGRPQRQARAISKFQLESVLSTLGDSLRDRRDRAVLALGFYGAFHRSELVAIDVGSLRWSDDGVVVHIAKSKTDQESKGRTVGVARTGGSASAVAALRGWIETADLELGPLFRRIGRSGKLGATRLIPEAVNAIVKNRLQAAGYDPRHYSGHSLRAGFVTEAALAGWPSWRIREQTGHANDATLARYVRTEGKPMGSFRVF